MSQCLITRKGGAKQKTLGITFSGNSSAVSDILEANGKTISYILFSCYDNDSNIYKCFLQYSDDGSTWTKYAYSGGGSGQYAGSIKKGTASGHKYWRLQAGTSSNWSLGGAVFIVGGGN